MKQSLLLHIKKYREPNTNIEKTENVFLVPELCKMTGMTDDQRSDFKAMKALSEHTKLTPEQRFRKSIEFGEILAKSSKSSGINIDTTNSKVNATILNPPTIFFGGNKTLTPTQGNYDMRNSIIDKTTFKEWSLIYQERDRDQCDKFVADLKKAS
jgi:aubergine-like protein